MWNRLGFIFFCLPASLLLITAVHAEPVDCSTGPLVKKHLEKGFKCADCHGVKTPAARCDTDFNRRRSGSVSGSACIKCHGSYDAMAKVTARNTINPHASPHYREMLGCTECHRGHQTSDNFCIRCHDDRTARSGWQSNSQPYAYPSPNMLDGSSSR